MNVQKHDLRNNHILLKNINFPKEIKLEWSGSPAPAHLKCDGQTDAGQKKK